MIPIRPPVFDGVNPILKVEYKPVNICVCVCVCVFIHIYKCKYMSRSVYIILRCVIPVVLVQ